MYDPTFLWHVTMAVHEDRVPEHGQSNQIRSAAPRTPIHRALGLYRRLVCRLQTRPARVTP